MMSIHKSVMSAHVSLTNEKGVRRDQCDPIWQIFCHFGKILKLFGNFQSVYFAFVKISTILHSIFDSIGQIFIAVNGQLLKNNLAIW